MRVWPKACHGSYYVKNRVDLVFQINTLNDTIAEDVFLRELVAAMGTANRKCFNTISLWNVNLPAQDEVYPRAANKMFHSAFSDARHRGYEAFFWMEHDVQPVVKNWLDRLYVDVVRHEVDYVMLGSIPQNKKWASLNLASPHFYMDHINGAALYSTQPDSIELFNYVEKVGKNHPDLAWDALISFIFHEWMAHGNSASWDMKVKFASKYRYHEFIYNNLGSDWRPSEYPKGTIFVHGNAQSTGNQLYSSQGL
ncbi:hypothetical protein PSENEW3n2_00000847 [Picochlorum sp. SENEW3]|nr:hypothetical protein PSENEW3n2_00000847 [Picochlorum sp. SENEW3]WPT15769.1 hypothetical protein PSENEW3_00000847 [Picochlorum sp. SENEW3]